MNATTLVYFKSHLLLEKSSILNKSADFRYEQSAAKENISDEAELASVDFVNTVSIHLHERHRSQLMMIERALGKIADGTYGQCESCSSEIGEKRLRARPFTSLCIECMEEREDRRNCLN